MLDTVASRLINVPRTLVIGHGGFSQIAPANTLPSFELATAAGVDLVELDYHHSQDGIPVVIHDSALDRTTDAATRWSSRNIKVAETSAAELAQLDAGSWFSSRYACTPVPTLEAALRTIQPAAVTLIERKTGDAATCVTLLRDKGWRDAVVVQSFDWSFLRACHQLDPELILGALGPPPCPEEERVTRGRLLNEAHLATVTQTGARIAVWNSEVTANAVRLAHAHGLRVWIYTINTIPQVIPLLEMGVDGIITDNPALIWKAMAIHALR